MQLEIPTLDDIACDPVRAQNLSRSQLTALLLRATVAQSAIAAALLNADATARDEPPDQTLNADEIARAVGQSRRWVFRHAQDLPFVVRTGRKSLVGSRAGLNRWLKARRA